MMAANNQHLNNYEGDLQNRLRLLSIRTNCPTRQENGQRYLGPPVNWTTKPPVNSEVFISKLPADCFEDEIYDFCSQVGKIYLIRLMINFENENRGFCFITFSNSKEATAAVCLLPQRSLRKGHYIHAEISLNNCTLKMYGLDFRWNDDDLEQEIRMNTKDVVNVTIKRNMAYHTLMATLYFDTHQKAAIARRKLSQIANARWGQNVKVFLWSKKLQNKNSKKQDSIYCKDIIKNKNTCVSEDNAKPSKTIIESSIDFFTVPIEKEDKMYSTQNIHKNDELCKWISKSKFFQTDETDSLFDNRDFSFEENQKSKNSFFAKITSCDLNNNCSFNMYEDFNDPFNPSRLTPNNSQFSSPISYFNFEDYSQQPTYSLSSESSPTHSKSSLSDMNSSLNWSSPDINTNSRIRTLDLHSPFDRSPEIYKNSSGIYSQNKQIEIILKEALEALTNTNLNETQ